MGDMGDVRTALLVLLVESDSTENENRELLLSLEIY